MELAKAGTWDAATGQVHLSPADLVAAVAAAPHLPDPIIKIGHTDPRFDGSPALGRVTNLRTVDAGHTLIGDLEGLPAWLRKDVGRTFPQRSIEAVANFQHEDRVFRFVLTGLSLLGASWPAVTSLESLQSFIEKGL